jgi:Zn-finger protein
MQCVCAILSSAACPAPHYFSTLFQKGTIFNKKVGGGVIENEKCVLIFSPSFSETFLIPQKK